MSSEALERRFAAVGARLNVASGPWRGEPRIDIRRNAAYVRQGEWFFVSDMGINPPDTLVLRNEPLSRGLGTPHVMQFAYRSGGEVVYVNRQHPSGISEGRFAQLTAEQQRHGAWA